MSVPDIQNALRLLENEEVEAAISTLEATVDELPAHLPAQVLLARAYETNDQWEKALRTWENARFLMPNSPTVKVGRERALRHVDEDAAERSSAPSTPTTEPTADRTEDAPTEDAPEEDAQTGNDRPEDDRPEGAEPEAPRRPDAPSTALSPETSPEPPTAGSPDEPETPPASPPSDRAPSERESSDDEGSEEGISDGGLPDGPTPDSFGSEGPSGLDELRQRAEQEARQGGSRPGLARQPSTPQPDEPETPDEDEPETDRETDQETDDVTGDLDRLIRELESARIEPTPDPDAPEDEYPDPDLDDDIDDLVSETLARIYAGQEQYREAARIYVKLASQEPSRARHHLQNAAEMREKADAQEAAQAEETDGAQ